MKLSRSLVLVSAGTLACSNTPRNPARENLVAALQDSLGKDAQPEVAFQRDSTNLQIELAAAPFAKLSDSAFTVRARDIARFALARYEKAGELDSITVLDRDVVSRGAWRIRDTRACSIHE